MSSKKQDSNQEPRDVQEGIANILKKASAVQHEFTQKSREAKVLRDRIASVDTTIDQQMSDLDESKRIKELRQELMRLEEVLDIKRKERREDLGFYTHLKHYKTLNKSLKALNKERQHILSHELVKYPQDTAREIQHHITESWCRKEE